jgi:flagella basal body P-ring formation protein FlgA
VTYSGRISKKFVFGIAAFLAIFSLSASASTSASSAALKTRIANEIEKRFSGARVEVLGGVAFSAGVEAPAKVESVSLINDNQRGEAQLLVTGFNADGEQMSENAWVRFTALMPAYVADRRILPGEKLDSDSISLKEVDVAQGMMREYRGILLPKHSDVSRLETRQTILEGQPALSSSVIRTPDVRKGEAIRIRLTSGTMTVSTSGIAEEPAYLDAKVRVTTSKTKRELVGKLRTGGVVEVQL